MSRLITGPLVPFKKIDGVQNEKKPFLYQASKLRETEIPNETVNQVSFHKKFPTKFKLYNTIWMTIKKTIKYYHVGYTNFWSVGKLVQMVVSVACNIFVYSRVCKSNVYSNTWSTIEFSHVHNNL